MNPPVAQLVERETVKFTANLKVTGSIPVGWISFVSNPTRLFGSGNIVTDAQQCTYFRPFPYERVIDTEVFNTAPYGMRHNNFPTTFDGCRESDASESNMGMPLLLDLPQAGRGVSIDTWLLEITNCLLPS